MSDHMNKVRPLPSGQSAYRQFNSTKQHFWRYNLIFYWTWMTINSLSWSRLTIAQHSTQLITVSYWKSYVPALVLMEELLNGSHRIFLTDLSKYKLKELFQKRNSWPLEYHKDPALVLCCSLSIPVPDHRHQSRPRIKLQYNTLFSFTLFSCL